MPSRPELSRVNRTSISVVTGFLEEAICLTALFCSIWRVCKRLQMCILHLYRSLQKKAISPRSCLESATHLRATTSRERPEDRGKVKTMALDGLGWTLGSVPTISKLKVIMRSGGFFRPLWNIWNLQTVDVSNGQDSTVDTAHASRAGRWQPSTWSGLTCAAANSLRMHYHWKQESLDCSCMPWLWS